MTKGIASWGWSTVPQQHLNGRVLWYTQAKVIGGGSSINAQVYTRGNAADYDAWVGEEGCTGWSYREVLPYFKRAEDNQRFADEFHGYGGPLGVSMPVNPLPISEAFLRAAQEYGIPYNPDFNGAKQDGSRPLPGDRAQRAPLLGLGRLSRADPPPAEPDDPDQIAGRPGSSSRAGAPSGVDGRRAAGAPRVLRCEREVLVTSGGDRLPAAAPALRHRPGRPSAAGRRARGPRPAGRRLQPPGPSGPLRRRRVQRRLHLRQLRQAAPHASGQASNTSCSGGARSPPRCSRLAASGTPTGRAHQPDTQFHLGLGSGIEAGVGEAEEPGLTLNSAFLQPRSRGTVRLQSADPAAAPLIDPNYWAEPYDRPMALRGLRMARDILSAAGAAALPSGGAQPHPGPDHRRAAG